MRRWEGGRRRFNDRPDDHLQWLSTTIVTRIGLGFSAAIVSLSLALTPGAIAQDKMGKDDGMKKDAMSNSTKDAMKKDDGMATTDGIKHDGTMKDGMKKDDGMKKN